MSATLIERLEGARAGEHRQGAPSGPAAGRADSRIVLLDAPTTGRRPALALVTDGTSVAAGVHDVGARDAGADLSPPIPLHRPRTDRRRDIKRRTRPRRTPTSARPSAQTFTRIAAGGTRGGRPGLRLTRRGRLTVTVATVLLTVTVGWIAHLSSAGQSTAPPAINAPASVVVRPGETLWDVATRVDPQADPRVVVGRIERLNSLDGPTVHPGQRLRLPAA